MRINSKTRWLALVMLVVAVCAISTQIWNQRFVSRFFPTKEVLSMSVAGRTVVLDPGHGGEDPGAKSSFGGEEKEIVLKIALELKSLLEESGATVIMTRDGDYDLIDQDRPPGQTKKRCDLENRKKIVQQSGGDLLISIHVNSIASSRWSGAQTFYSNHLEENRLLATMVQESLKKNLGGTERVAKEIDAYIVRTAEIPSILVETGFISNPREGRLLAQHDYQRKVAYAIYQGISGYFSGQFRY
jgi:N-acetylmuramoyl-L-alanine amidase